MSLIAVAAEQPDLQMQARVLADELDLPFQGTATQAFDFLLMLTPERLELCPQQAGQGGPIYADFAGAKATYRRRFGGGRDQTLARALGLKHGWNPSVLDTTAGLGRDAFVLASLGCRVCMIERSALIAALLRDALTRARHDPELGLWIEQRMQLRVGDSREYLLGIRDTDQPEVIYLDPMYPGRDKSALVKKEFRLLRTVVGADEDAAGLLEAALPCARRRVVVKRPRGAPYLAEREPHHSIKAPNTRFDVYLPHA